MKNAERARPSTIGLRKRSLSSGPPTLPSRYMLPSSGAAVLQASGPSGDNPVRCSTIAVSRWVRCCPSGRICGVSTPAARALSLSSTTSSSERRAVMIAALVLLVGRDDVAHERLDLRGDFVGAFRADATVVVRAHDAAPGSVLQQIWYWKGGVRTSSTPGSPREAPRAARRYQLATEQQPLIPADVRRSNCFAIGSNLCQATNATARRFWIPAFAGMSGVNGATPSPLVRSPPSVRRASRR